MVKLARKITPAKWNGSSWASCKSIPSDALTVCMKTSGNTLSFWRVEATEQGEEKAVLALLGTQQRIDKIDIVFVDREEFSGIDFVDSQGSTIFSSLRDLHVDVAELSHDKFIAVAEVLGRQVYGDKIIRLTRAQFKSKMQAALDEKMVSWETIPESMRTELREPKC